MSSATPLLSTAVSASGARKAPVLAKRELVGAKTDRGKSALIKDSNISKGEAYFHDNINLAVSMGFYIMIFCIPVCSDHIGDLLFNKLGLAELMGSTVNQVKAQWPLVFTLMFFMVKDDTGTTIQNLWSGLMGIVTATLNILILAYFFPHGGKCKTQSTDPISTGLRLYCKEYSDSNYDSVWGWVVWIDLFLFLFLQLASQVPEATKKWGMCQTIAYIMSFMGTDGYHSPSAQVLTSLLGLSLGVCVTLVPNIFQMMNGKKMDFPHVATLKLRYFPGDLAERIENVLMNSINFLDKSAELDRHTRTSMRFSLESEIDEINPVIQRMQAVYNASTWEQFLFRLSCHHRRWVRDRMHVRRFINAFQDNIGGFDDLLYAIKKVVLSDDHSNYSNLTDDERRSVDRERDLVKRQLFDLSRMTSHHLCMIARPPNPEGVDTYDETAAIKEIGDKAKALRNAYALIQDLPNNVSKPRERLRNQLGCYVFATLCYSRSVTDTFSVETRDLPEAPTAMGKDIKTYCLLSFGDVTEDGYKPLSQVRTDRDTKYFVVRNMVSIFSCFVMGNFLMGNVFPGWSPTCASTLALLISHFPGSAFDTNLQRLLGLTLGKVVPIIIMAVVSFAGNSGPIAQVVHLLFIWAYEAFFAYVYYTSPEWGGMACLVAGFGCGALIGSKATTWSADQFKTQYMEIGQVTACIMFQMLVDVIDTSIRKRWPRDRVVTNMAKLGMTVNDNECNEQQTQQQLAGRDMDGAIVTAFEHFMKMDDGSMKEMRKCIEEAKKLTVLEESLIHECRPRSVVIRGAKTPFKFDAAQQALTWIKRLLQEMELLYMVYDKGPVAAAAPEPQFVHNLHLDNEFQNSILTTMRLTFMDLQMVFKHDKDGYVKRPYKANPKLPDLDMNWRVKTDTAAAQRPGDFRRDLCVCVAQRALFDSLSHVSELQHVCYSAGGFAYEGHGSKGQV